MHKRFISNFFKNVLREHSTSIFYKPGSKLLAVVGDIQSLPNGGRLPLILWSIRECFSPSVMKTYLPSEELHYSINLMEVSSAGYQHGFGRSSCITKKGLFRISIALDWMSLALLEDWQKPSFCQQGRWTLFRVKPPRKTFKFHHVGILEIAKILETILWQI